MTQLAREGFWRTLARFPTDARRDFRPFWEGLAAPIRDMTRADRAHAAVLAIILLAGIAARVAMINRPMMDDESTTYLVFASKPFSEALSSYGIPNNHLLNTALARASILIFGNSPAALRLPSLIAGCLSIVAGYAFARAAYNKETALLAAGLIASASYMIDYSTVSRGYSFVNTGFMLMLALAASLRAKWNTFGAILLAGVGALSMHAIPIAAYPIVVTFVWLGASLALERRREIFGPIGRDYVLSGLLTVALTALLYLPVMLRAERVSVLQMASPAGWADFVAYYGYSLPIMWDVWNGDLPALAVYALLAAFAGALALHWKMARYSIPIALVAVILVPALVTASGTVVPGERIWSFLLPLYLATAAAGIVFAIQQAERIAPARVVQGTLLALPALVTLIQTARVTQHQSTYVWSLDLIHHQGAAIAAFLDGDPPPRSAILSMYGSYPAINYYQVYQGVSPQPDYVNWGRILSGREAPSRLYVLVVVKDGQPEQKPDDIAAIFGLDPSQYSEFTLIQTFDRVLLYSADRVGP